MFTSEGAFIRVFGDGAILHTPWDVAVSPSGTVYVTDWNGIEEYDSSGGFLGKLGTGIRPYSVALDGAGNIFVSDSENMFIYKCGPSGNLLLTFGGRGSEPGLFNQPADLAVDGAGNLYIADYSNYRIQKFSPGGSLLSFWGTPGTGPGQFNTTEGVAAGPDGSVYVSENVNGRVQKFGYAPTPVQSVTWGRMKARYRGERGAAQPTALDR